jgi:hypothetical protein
LLRERYPGSGEALAYSPWKNNRTSGFRLGINIPRPQECLRLTGVHFNLQVPSRRS